MLCILVNSVCLAIYDYSDENETTAWNKTLNVFGDVFTVVFLLEAVVKILAMGFIIGPYTYLRDGWNVMDFIIVLTG